MGFILHIFHEFYSRILIPARYNLIKVLRKFYHLFQNLSANPGANKKCLYISRKGWYHIQRRRIFFLESNKPLTSLYLSVRLTAVLIREDCKNHGNRKWPFFSFPYFPHFRPFLMDLALLHKINDRYLINVFLTEYVNWINVNVPALFISALFCTHR